MATPELIDIMHCRNCKYYFKKNGIGYCKGRSLGKQTYDKEKKKWEASEWEETGSLQNCSFFDEKKGKLLKNIEEEKEVKKRKNSPAFIFEREGQVLEFIKHQPIFYDESGMWWIWDKENNYWRYHKDEINILNLIREQIGVNTINSKDKTEIINGLKQVGRKHSPEEITKNWIQFKNKIIDLENDAAFKADSKYFITNPIPWNIGESEETPTMDKYFKEWVVKDGLQDESYIQTLYEIIAYSCLRKQFLQRLFAFVGSGSNGKGVWLSILKKFLGKENICSTELRILSENGFESSGLYKKQACFMGEVDAYDMKNTNLIKKLSGEDDIRYCFKGKTPFTEESATTCFMNTNSLPVSPDKSKGFYRRWLIIDFPHEFPVGKDILADIPEKEFENLAKKVIRICKELLEKKSFTNEGDIEKRMKRYEERANPLMRFIEDYCIEDYDEYVPLKQLIHKVNEYLKENRLRILTPKRIKQTLKDEGFEIQKTTRDTILTQYVLGISLKVPIVPIVPKNDILPLHEGQIEKSGTNGTNGTNPKKLTSTAQTTQKVTEVTEVTVKDQETKK